MTAASGNRYSRRYPMTDYNWQQLAHDLATEVMGWELNEFHHIYTLDAKMMAPKDKWRPWKDLNKAWMLGKALDLHFDTHHNAGNGMCVVSINLTNGAIIAEEHESPAKAIMLAVAKASDLNLTDYEVSDE
jgi:hypothetical protein